MAGAQIRHEIPSAFVAQSLLSAGPFARLARRHASANGIKLTGEWQTRGGNNVRLSAAQAPFVLRTFATSARSKSDRRSPERQMAQRHVPARHLNASSDKKSMRRIVLVSSVLICGSLFVGCSRKPAQTAPPPPEVLVTTVTAARRAARARTRRDAGRFHQRQHQRAGSRLHRLARLPGGRRGKEGRPPFSDRFPAVRSRIGAGQGNSGKRQSQPGKSRRGRKTRDRLV